MWTSTQMMSPTLPRRRSRTMWSLALFHNGHLVPSPNLPPCILRQDGAQLVHLPSSPVSSPVPAMRPRTAAELMFHKDGRLSSPHSATEPASRPSTYVFPSPKTISNSQIEILISVVPKRHDTFLTTGPPPLDLARYEIRRVADRQAASCSEFVEDFRRHFFLPRTLDGRDCDFIWCRHQPSDAHSALHLPHTWLDCSGAVAGPDTLFVNWQTGDMRADVPRIPASSQWSRLCALEETWGYPAAAEFNVDDDSGQDEFVEDHLLVGLDADLWALVREIVAGRHAENFVKTREKIGSAFCRSMMGLSDVQVRVAADLRLRKPHPHNCEGKAENGSLQSLSVGVYVFPGTSVVRRRALLIACTYGNNSYPCSNGQPASKLHSTVNDAVTIHDMLVGRRRWRSQDIVLLTDVSEPAGVEMAKKLHEKGVRVYGSTVKNVALWMGRLVSGLKGNTGENVSNSLMLFMAGHGAQYAEVPTTSCQMVSAGKLCAKDARPFHVENDGLDEGFWTSSIVSKIGVDRETGKKFKYDQGVVLDDLINSVLAQKVYCLQRTQLVCLFDCCNSGTMVDLPFLLIDKKNDNPRSRYNWRTHGEARRLEESGKGFPQLYDCGKGIVYSFSASVDGGEAVDAANETIAVRRSKNGSQTSLGGAMTKAFAASCLADGSGTVLEGIVDVKKSVRTNYEIWKDYYLRSHNIVEDGSENVPFERQRPCFASSHFCRIDQTPLFL